MEETVVLDQPIKGRCLLSAEELGLKKVVEASPPSCIFLWRPRHTLLDGN